MKTKASLYFALTVIVICFLPFSALGQNSVNYLTLKGGIYSPQGDLDDVNFDTGFNGELSIGRYFHPNFALELSGGYFKSDTSVSGSNDSLGTFSQEDEIKVIPVTLTGKFVYKSQKWEFFGAVGAGVYFADFEGVQISSVKGIVNVDDDDSVFGVNLGLGVTYDITEVVFIGVEGKYIITDDAKFTGVTPETNLNGIIATANIGFRF